MDFVLPERHSLKWIALHQIAVHIWDNMNGKHLASKIYFSESNHRDILRIRKQWEGIEDALMKKIEQLHIIPTLKTELAEYIFAIGWEFILWFDYHVQCDDQIRFTPDSFFWTPYGTIDGRKTAMAIVQDTNLDILLRYKFACIYFLESQISELRPMAVNSNSEAVFSFQMSWNMIFRFGQPQLEYFARRESEAGVRFSFEKLSDEKKKHAPLMTAEIALLYCTSCNSINIEWLFKTRFPHVLWFLLSTMSKNAQTYLIQDKAMKVLQCFLCWPYQSFFLETAMHVQNYLDPEDFVTVLEIIAIKILHSIKDFNYKQLFRQFWLQSSESHKKFVLNNPNVGNHFSTLLFAGDQESISLILSNASVRQKENLIFSLCGDRIYRCMLSDGDWAMLKYCVCLCISSAKKALKLKKNVKSCPLEWEWESADKKFIQIIEEFVKEKKH